MKKNVYFVILLMVCLLVSASHISACPDGDACPTCVQAHVWTAAVVLAEPVGIVDARMDVLLLESPRILNFHAPVASSRAPPIA